MYYASARKSMVWKTDVKYDYSPLRLGQLIVSAGNTTTDFNPNGVNRQDNAMSSFYGVVMQLCFIATNSLKSQTT